MGEERRTILRLIRLVLTEKIRGAGELKSALPDPRSLGPVEKAAWIELYFWGDDADVGISDYRWQSWSAERLRHLFSRLETRFTD